jgi:crotonobetainyl-CoA:carnitine CoA-transferase CaiB-like acyl-CoA transferase
VTDQPSATAQGGAEMLKEFESDTKLEAHAEPSPHPVSPAGPLTGIKVLDLTSYLAGPYGCALLGDMGAEVIKVESPQGDMMRHYPSTMPGESRAFVGTNRNKYSVVLDLKQPEGLAALLRLVETADVLIHNFRPSVPGRLGIDYERLKGINERLIYCAITGFGDTGPLANNAGFDQVLQCMTGLCTFQGGEGNPPEVVLGSVVDYYTSALVAFGVSSALFQRERDGKGQYIGASLLRTALAMQSGRFVWAEGEGAEANRDIRLAPLTGIHPTKEGYLYISSHSKHFWEALCEMVGMPDFARDPRFGTMKERIAHAHIIVPRLRELLAKRTAVEWAEMFGERVPNAPVRPIEDMFDHPQVLDQDLVTTYEHPVVGRYRGFTKPLALSRTPGPAPFAAPTFGQHTAEVLRNHGYSAEEVADLQGRGVVQ